MSAAVGWLNRTPVGSVTGVFSGQAGWNEVVFDLEGYLGAATFVFHFVSDASGSGEGWYVDDVSVLGTQDVSAVDPIGPATLGLQLAAASLLDVQL